MRKLEFLRVVVVLISFCTVVYIITEWFKQRDACTAKGGILIRSGEGGWACIDVRLINTKPPK